MSIENENGNFAKPMLADGACNLLAKPLHESTIESSTDRTMKVFRIWCQSLKEFEKQGVFLRSENLTVGNSYATKKGGFWNEVRYFF